MRKPVAHRVGEGAQVGQAITQHGRHHREIHVEIGVHHDVPKAGETREPSRQAGLNDATTGERAHDLRVVVEGVPRGDGDVGHDVEHGLRGKLKPVQNRPLKIEVYRQGFDLYVAMALKLREGPVEPSQSAQRHLRVEGARARARSIRARPIQS